MGSQTLFPAFPIADLHTHPLLHLYYRRRIDVSRIQASGVRVMVFCVYALNRLPRRNCFENAKDQIAAFEKLMRDHADTFSHAKSPDEIEGIVASGKIATVLALEGGHHVADDLKNLDDFQKAGVFYITLVHFTNTTVGECCHFADFSSETGLRPFGRSLIAEMNRRGIAVDVSHASERLFWDVMSCSRTPPLYTHGGARALCDHSRNLTDEQGAAIAKAGGLIGAIFYPKYLNGSFCGSVGDIIRHLEHWLNVAGPHAIAIGSDMYAVLPPKKLGGYDKMPLLRDAVIDAFGEPLAQKILFENAVDYMKRVWTRPA